MTFLNYAWLALVVFGLGPMSRTVGAMFPRTFLVCRISIPALFHQCPEPANSGQNFGQGYTKRLFFFVFDHIEWDDTTIPKGQCDY